ncbi:STAS domain-containing protein [Thalassotalea sp. G2M2-11]|uniref:STAS domain-containing protein n=1 Tax=Thalassotalea sp. G2M2-11 TaxID=2787627 RepID=UPI0019D0D2E8|nr:STAS domain-containing protein [Thalassotalea sp. G2M2-11]
MFKLPAELTIANMDECKAKFIEYVDQHDEITLDDSEVNRIDTVGIQLLLNAITYISAQNKTLTWQNQSSIVEQSIKLLGINEPILNQYLKEE